MVDVLKSVPRDLYLGGAFVAGAERSTLFDPATEESLIDVAMAGPVDVDAAVQAAHRALPVWRALAPAQRAAWLARLAAKLEETAAELAAVEAVNVGKPIWETARVDVPAAISATLYYASAARQIEGRTVPADGPFLTYTVREPHGVVAAIVPWNYPLMQTMWKIAPALAAGNVVVVKTSELTPLSALVVARCLHELEFPAGVVNVLVGAGPVVGEHLVTHPGVDMISFTGSTRTGARIGELAARTFKPVTLELGGKSAHLVFEDADPAKAARAVFNGMFLSQGQMCVAGSRLIAHEGVADSLLEHLSARVSAMHLGHPLDPETRVGPQASREQLEKTLSYIELAMKEGARARVGGGRPADRPKGFYILPTILQEVRQESRAVQEEIFGPVLTVQTFRTEDEALALAQDSAYGLAAGIQTRDVARAHRVAAQLEVGTVWINTYGLMSPSMPHGGRRQSGHGRELGHEGLDEYTVAKSVWVNLRD